MTDRNRGRSPKRTPLAAVECVGIQHGRRILAATYPSSRANVAPHTATFLDDGHFESCTCDAGQRQVRCWHADAADAAITEYFRQQHATDNAALRRAYISSVELYLTFPLDDSDAAAAHYELIGLRLAEQDAARVAA